MERRRVDEEERQFQARKREGELAKANEKLFQDSEQVRALNSKLLFCDTLKGREQQIDVKHYLKDIEKQREEHFHEETMVDSEGCRNRCGSSRRKTAGRRSRRRRR